MSLVMTDYLPKTRCSFEMKRKLEEIAANSPARELADHIRFAVELYIAENWREEYASDTLPETPEPELVK
jgi:hypothetical protein